MSVGEDLSKRKYWAFISYSSKDRKWGQWLHKRLENYPIPEQFRGTKLFDGAVLGKSLRPVFRDRDELSGSADLGPAIMKALEETRYLIVLCSKNSAKSEWVNKEIEDFKAMGRERQILALILDGVPNATSSPGTEDSEECFPPALRYPAEPLAGDLRKEGDGKERGFLKILSGVAQLDFDALYRRHERNQRRRRLIMGSVATVVVVAMAGLSAFAMIQRGEAVRQRGVAQDNERIAKENEAAAETQRGIAETQRGIATQQALQAKMDLSNKQLEQGLEYLSKGMIEEGIAMLRNSLATWPENVYARDRMMFELSHRAWLMPVYSGSLPFQFLAEEKFAQGGEEQRQVKIGLRPSEGGGITLSESIAGYDEDAGEFKVFLRESKWKEKDGWIVGQSVAGSQGDDELEEEGLLLANGLRVLAEPVETSRGCWDVLVTKGGESLNFRRKSFDGETDSPVRPFGVPVLSPDGKTLAVVGLQRPLDVDEETVYGSEGEIIVNFYDAATLIEKKDADFSYTVASDADIMRVWWEGDRIAIHTRRDNRSFDRFDLIDVSGENPEFIALNKAIKSELWFFGNGRIHLISNQEADGTQRWVMEIQEVMKARDWKIPGKLGEGDFVWFEDQKRSVAGDSGFTADGSWEQGASGFEWSSWIAPGGESVAAAWVGPAGERTAKLNSAGSIEITPAGGGEAVHVAVKRVSGEGGRSINGLGFSPDGAYVVVQGFSAGGGVDDWQILGADIGKTVFPVIYPRDRRDEIELVDIYIKSGNYGLGAIAWSRDGGLVLLGSTEVEGKSPDSKGWKGKLLRDLEQGERYGGMLVPIRFCDGPVPGWFLEAVDAVIGIRVTQTGQFLVVPGKAGTLDELQAKNPSGEYGEWLAQFLGKE